MLKYNKVKKIILKIIANVYERIFQDKITHNIQLFIKNFGFVMLGYGIAALFIFAFQIIAGRILGPSEYGKYVLVDSVAIFLHILMMLGISTAAVRYLAEKSDYKEQRKLISTSYFLVFIFSSLFSFLFFIFLPQLSKFFNISPLILRLSVIFAYCYTLYILAVDTLRGLHRMKKLAIFRAGYGFMILVVFGIFILFFKYISFLVAVFSISFAYLIIFFLITLNLSKYFSNQFNKALLNKFLRYGLYVVIGGLCFTFLPHLSKILVNKYLTIKDVGIYNAYYFPSLGLVVFLSTVFITVFFPTASRYPEKEPIFQKIKKFLPYLFLGGVPFLFGTEMIILFLYGTEYPINYFLMLLFAISGVLMATYGIYNWLFYSQGILGGRLAAFITLIVILLNLLLSLYLIPILALSGAIISLGLSYLVGINCLLFFRHKIVFNKSI